MSKVPETGAVLRAIRDRTRESHARLERRFALLRSPTRSGYARYLRHMGGVVVALERRAVESADLAKLLPDVAARCNKGELLRADLRDLGHEPGDLEEVPLPPARTPVELMGQLYVLEGSTLGGTVLARELEAALGALPTRYLRCYGEATAARWRAFVTGLERAASPELAEPAAISAEAMFLAVEQWLESGSLLLDARSS